MRSLDLGELMFHNRKYVWRKILFENSLIVFDRGIFTALALRNDRVVASSCDNGFDIHPASMKCSRDCARFRRRSSELPDLRLKFRRETRALFRALCEEFLPFGIRHVVGGSLESVLAVTARFNQVVKTVDELLPIHSHGSPPPLEIFAIALPVGLPSTTALIAGD